MTNFKFELPNGMVATIQAKSLNEAEKAFKENFPHVTTYEIST